MLKCSKHANIEKKFTVEQQKMMKNDKTCQKLK
jgi:hypothetical protein